MQLYIWATYRCWTKFSNRMFTGMYRNYLAIATYVATVCYLAKDSTFVWL